MAAFSPSGMTFTVQSLSRNALATPEAIGSAAAVVGSSYTSYLTRTSLSSSALVAFLCVTRVQRTIPSAVGSPEAGLTAAVRRVCNKDFTGRRMTGRSWLVGGCQKSAQ